MWQAVEDCSKQTDLNTVNCTDQALSFGSVLDEVTTSRRTIKAHDVGNGGREQRTTFGEILRANAMQELVH